jgi:hypothetical protein
MIREKNIEKNNYGDETPRWKDILVVIIVFGLITALSWIAWFKLGWFH